MLRPLNRPSDPAAAPAVAVGLPLGGGASKEAAAVPALPSRRAVGTARQKGGLRPAEARSYEQSGGRSEKGPEKALRQRDVVVAPALVHCACWIVH